MRYASGRHALGQCARCGMRGRYTDMVDDGQTPGLRVHRSCRDTKHPSEKPLRHLDDATALRRPAPDLDDDHVGRAHYLTLPGTAGSYASTPDSAALDITGDIDVRVKLAAADWTAAGFQHFIAKRGGTSSWLFRLQTGGTGLLDFEWTEDGGSPFKGGLSTAAPGFADGSTHWVRATLDVDNGAGGWSIRYYTSEDGQIWNQLGATVTGAGATSIANSDAQLQVGAGGGGELLAGKVFYAEVRNGIGGEPIAVFDAADCDVGDSSFESSETGEAWTLNGDAEITRLLLAEALGFSNYFGGGT